MAPTTETDCRGLLFDGESAPTGDAVSIIVDADSLVVTRNDSRPADIRLDSITVEWGGIDRTQLVIRDRSPAPSRSEPEEPDAAGPQPAARMLLIADPRFLDTLSAAAGPELAARLDALRQSRRGSDRRWRAAGLALATVIALATLELLRGAPLLTGLAMSLVPPAWESSAGKLLVRQFLAGQRVLDDPAVTKELSRLIAPLVEALGPSPYRFEFHVVASDDINAFALPGGQVVLLTGLVKTAASAEEVAGVLAHEIQHVVGRHTLRSFAQRVGLSVVLGLLLGDVQELAGLASILMTSRYSRTQESWADAEGARLLVRAGLPVEPMAAFFEKLQARDSGAGQALEFLASHPASAGRAAAVRKLALQQNARPPKLRSLGIDWPRFQSLVATRSSTGP
ncbi:MAG: M48 family metallopeptidase [Candidatus Wallbacteria bacterium]|nr:M48 family metallopeptidase [Candidatus Wallbacteria bacterium]